MSACPKCKNVTEDAFGLTTCDKCGENFFAGAVSEDDANDNNEQVDNNSNEAVDNVELADDSKPLEDNDFNEPPNEDLGFPTTEDSTPDFSSDEFANFQEEQGEENLQVEETKNQEEVPLNNEFKDEMSTSDATDELQDHKEEVVNEDVNLENMIEDVEKNENPSYDIYYHVEIEGIDSPMIREKVLEELDDPRLGWKLADLQIKMGRLVLENVSSTKAHVVVCSMLSLPVKVMWKQKQ